ncbi:MAG: hypothetical protein AB8B92_10745 [Gammaproteobacteria bacterium]
MRNIVKLIARIFSAMFYMSVITVLFAETVSAAESCFAASDSGDRLVLVVDRTDGSTAIDVGPLGVSNIEALAKEPITGVVYGANANRLGTINLDTGAYAASPNTFGTALAANGNLTSDRSLNDVDALAFDLSTGYLYGVQNASGPEILFRINPTTGALVTGAMGGNDYLLIGTSGSIDDLAVDQAGTMFASSANNLYTINFAAVGTTNASLVGAFGGPNDMEGLSTDVPGNLIGTTGANNSNSAFNNSLWTINKATGAASAQVSIPIGGDYEGVTCALADVDLSLTKTAVLTNDADASGTISAGDEVTYSILVINNDANQIASGVEVTDNINALSGLTFVSSSSTKPTSNPYSSVTGLWSVGVVPANTSYQLDLIYSVGAAAGGSTITNTAEITQSANPDPDSEPNNDDGDQSEDDEDNAAITVVAAPPTISKSFSPSSINAGGVSQLTITLGNTNANAITLSADLDDNLPASVTVTSVNNVATTCTDASVVIIPNTRVRYASGATIPTGGCDIVVNVTSSTLGVMSNVIATNALQTNAGNNVNIASANLTVTASGGGSPACPAGTNLVTLAVPRNATTATSAGSVTGTISNGTGAILAIGTNVAGSGEPRLTSTPASVTLGFADIVPLNGNIILSLAQDNSSGLINIQDSTDNISFSSIVSFSGSNPTDDRVEHLNYSVGSANGAQFVRFTLAAGGFRVDGLEYSQICEPLPQADLSITKDDGSLVYTPGGTGTYTIVVTNNGPDDVTGATIADNLPNGVTMTSAWTCTPSSVNSSCNTVPSTTDPISIDVDIVDGDTITINVPVQFSSNMGDY